MDIKGQYLTYQEYKGLGGTLELTPFSILEYEARKKIDIRTLNRLKNKEPNKIPEEVKMCEFSLINSIVSYTSNENKNIVSENIDGYSVSYINPTQISEVVNSKNAEFNDIIDTYLFGVFVNNEHLLYAGVDIC